MPSELNAPVFGRREMSAGAVSDIAKVPTEAELMTPIKEHLTGGRSGCVVARLAH
jgi:hypothetical protein